MNVSEVYCQGASNTVGGIKKAFIDQKYLKKQRKKTEKSLYSYFVLFQYV